MSREEILVKALSLLASVQMAASVAAEFRNEETVAQLRKARDEADKFLCNPEVEAVYEVLTNPPYSYLPYGKE